MAVAQYSCNNVKEHSHRGNYSQVNIRLFSRPSSAFSQV